MNQLSSEQAAKQQEKPAKNQLKVNRVEPENSAARVNPNRHTVANPEPKELKLTLRPGYRVPLKSLHMPLHL